VNTPLDLRQRLLGEEAEQSDAGGGRRRHHEPRFHHTTQREQSSDRSVSRRAPPPPPLLLRMTVMTRMMKVTLKHRRQRKQVSTANPTAEFKRYLLWLGPQGRHSLPAIKREATAMVIIARWPLENNLSV